MKIVSVMTTSGLGGAEFAAVEMLDGLVQRGHEAVVLTNEPRLGRDTGVRIEPLDIGPKLSTGTWPRLMLRWGPYMRRLRSALEAEAPYDVLLVHYKKEQLMARWLPAHLRARLVWAEWGPVPFPLRKGLPARMFLAAARRAAAIMAVSAGTKASVESVGVPPEKVVYVANAVRTDEIRFSEAGRERVRRELGVPPDAFTVGCISRFHHKKRNDVVVDAVLRMPGEPHLILAGEGDTEADLRSRASPLGDRVHFIPTPGADVTDVLSAFDVSVFCPSPTEGAPRAVILGMLAERPCVSTGREGVADIIVEGVGEIVSPENDPAALAACLQGYADQPERVAAEGAEGRRRAVETYAMPVVAEHVERIFSGAEPTGGGNPGPVRVVSVITTGALGGAEYASVDMLEALAERNVDVKLLTNRPELAQGSAVPVSEIQLGPKLGRRTALRVALGFGPGLARLLRALRAERREGPVDVLLVHFKKEQLMARLVPRSLAPTVVWAEWGPLPLEFRHGLARRLYARAARRARRILAVSENTKRSIVEAGVPEEKVDVLPSIVDAELVAFDPAARERHRREWGASDETFVIACVSRLHPKKRNDVVIDALEHLPEDVLLVVAGSGEGEPELRRRASRFGERVRFIPTPRGHVHEVLSACDVQVFAPQPLEGAPRSIVFGQLTERPVIATAAMGAAEMVLPETGTIVPIEHDARALAACLEEYRVDPDRRAREGAAGRRYALTHHDGRAVGDAVARVVRESHGAGVR